MKVHNFECGLPLIQEAFLIPDRDIVVVTAPLIQFKLLPRTPQICRRVGSFFNERTAPEGSCSPGAEWAAAVLGCVLGIDGTYRTKLRATGLMELGVSEDALKLDLGKVLRKVETFEDDSTPQQALKAA